MKIASVLICASIAWAQPPESAQTRASVSGEVSPVGVDSREKTTVRLQGQGELRTVMAAREVEDGRFLIGDLGPGDYTLSAQRPGFIQSFYNASPANPRGVFTLRRGQDLSGIRIALVPEGVLAGRILDPDDNPIGPAQVTLWRKVWNNGKPQLQLLRTSMAANDGAFHVSGLDAGKYYLSVAPAQENGLVGSYFPNSTDPAAAAPLTVGPGAEIGGITLHLRRERAFRVRGRVVDPAGVIVKNIALGVVNPSGSTSLTLARDGTFALNRLMPGTYVIATQIVMLNGQAIRPDVPLVGRKVITISETDLDDFVFELHAPARIEGSIRAEKQKPGVRLVAEEFRPHSATASESDENGAFAIEGLAPDRYRVEASGLAPGNYVKSVRFANQDSPDGVIDLTPGNGGSLEIATAADGVEIAGVVRDEKGNISPDVVVSLWGGRVPPKSAVTGKDGSFHFGNLPPGDYKVAAWESVDSDLVTLPEFLNQFAGRAAVMNGSAAPPRLTPIPRALTDIEAEKLR